MIIYAKTKIKDLLDDYPFMLNYLTELSPKFSLLRNPIARKTIGNVATLTQAASLAGLDVNALIEKIATKIELETGKEVKRESATDTALPFTDKAAKHEVLKAIIRSLHDGGDFDEAKRQFAELVRDIDASEIASMEQRLIQEGMPQEEVKRLCDVHVQVFKESIEVKTVPDTPEGHPVHSFMIENRALEKLLDRVADVMQSIGTPPSADTYAGYHKNLTKLLDSLQKVHLHYLRKENQLFPILEKHEVTGPSQVMWSLDDDIRAMIKRCIGLHREHDIAGLIPAINKTSLALRDMIYKEERILFPMAIDSLSPQEWEQVKTGEEEIGYAWIMPSDERQTPEIQPLTTSQTGAIPLSTGTLTREQIDLMLTALPVDISFVDENDEVRYYSATGDRIFPRSPGVVGRKVQNCHPPKSMHVVQKLLDDFRSGARGDAEFWIEMQQKLIYIRYFALRSATGEYRGCIELTQDVTHIKNLTGEKRLLD